MLKAIVPGVAWAMAVALPQLASAAPLASGPTETSVTMLSDSGDYIGQGQSRFFYPGNGSVSITGDTGYLTVHADGGTLGDSFDMDFAAPPGGQLSIGLYTGAQRAPFRSAGHPGIDISGDGRGCNEDGGRFDVKDIKVALNGSIKRLWLTYEQHCENGVSALFGEVRVGVPTSNPGVLIASSLLWWPDTYVGAFGTVVPVTLVDTGSSPFSIVKTKVAGVSGSDFAIRLDQCKGFTLYPGDLCQVLIRFSPSVGGPRVGQLVFVDAGGHHYRVGLDGSGIPGVTKFVMHSDTGDYIGGGLDYHYTPSNATIGFYGSPPVVHASIDGDNGDWWSADFEAPEGDILAPGTYHATRYPFNGSGAGMDISGNGRGCNQLNGTFTVTEISIAPDNSLSSFGLKFKQHCEGAAPALRGTLDYRVPVGDVTPPGQVSNLVVTRGQGKAEVAWADPSDFDLAFVVVRYLRGTVAPGAPNGGFPAFAGLGTSATIAGLSSSTPLAVAVWTVDASGNVGQRVVSFTP